MTNDLTAYLAGVKALADAATEGPWVDVKDHDVYLRRGDVSTVGVPGERDIICEHAGLDAPFIAASRTAVPTLHAMVEAVQALHVPERVTISVPMFDEFDSPTQIVDRCFACKERLFGNKPCPTVRAMTAVLDRKENER